MRCCCDCRWCAYRRFLVQNFKQPEEKEQRPNNFKHFAIFDVVYCVHNKHMYFSYSQKHAHVSAYSSLPRSRLDSRFWLCIIHTKNDDSSRWQTNVFPHFLSHIFATHLHQLYLYSNNMHMAFMHTKFSFAHRSSVVAMSLSSWISVSFFVSFLRSNSKNAADTKHKINAQNIRFTLKKQTWKYLKREYKM